MIVSNLIFWAGCPSGAPHAPCKSCGVRFLWLAGLFFPCLHLTGSWLSRELVAEDSPRTVPPKNLQFSLDWTKCCSQGQAPVHTHFRERLRLVPFPCSMRVRLPIHRHRFLNQGCPIPLWLHLMHLKKAIQHSPPWISIIFRILLISAPVVSS